MRAIVCRELGPPEKLVVEERPSPPLSPGEIRIRVAGADVNFPDVLVLEGKYQLKLQPPFVPGAAAAGRVVEVGAAVATPAVGDDVAVFCQSGGFAEEVVVKAAQALVLPPGLDVAAAATLTVAHGTSLHALRQRAALAPGETLLVLGAAGGVGLAAVELGRRMGARVIAAASSAEKLALAASRGADAVVDYSATKLRDAVRDLTGGRGADVIYDPVGGALGEEALSCIAWNGRLLVVGFASGAIPSYPANRLLLKGASAVGVFWGGFVEREPATNAANFADLWRWFADGEIRPHIARRYALDETPLALREMLDRRLLGKALIVP
jgi:NADPH2:quinone reductase